MEYINLYYLSIFAPLLFIVWISKIDVINSRIFIALLFLYALIYRTYLDGKRLEAKNIIQERDIWKINHMGNSFKYFKELYLK
jgi:hypothetical protein